MAKDLWCTRCESERDWSDIRQHGLDAESIYCSCGAFAGPGSDQVLLIEAMTPEERAEMDLAKGEAIVFTDRDSRMIASVDQQGSLTLHAPDGATVEQVPNAAGGVDVRITVREAVSEHMTEVGKAVYDAVRHMARRYNGLLPDSMGRRFDQAMDTASRLGSLKPEEPPPDPKFLVPTQEQKEANRLNDAAVIGSLWDALRPKG